MSKDQTSKENQKANTDQSIEEKLVLLEARMAEPTFWQNKEEAKRIVEEYQNLKIEVEGGGKYDRSNAVMTIFSGAGGTDSEDFSRILLEMYTKYCNKVGFSYSLLHENKNDHDGYRNVTIEITGKNVYGTLKHESGVHRLVRISPFNSKNQRHTSFSMVEVVPEFDSKSDMNISLDEIEFEFSRSSGPGGQNVNKRETAVRVVHTPTKISAHVDSERSQAQNKEKALQLLRGKIFKALEEERIQKEENMYISKTTEIEWGNQIRSYVFHPYKMIKDHRTGVEERMIDNVLQGDLDAFIEAENKILD